MKGKLFAVLMGASLVLAACGGGDEASTTDNASDTTKTVSAGDAEKIYTQSCSQCHGGDLKGGSSFPDLTAVGAKLSVEEIETIIAEGKGIMPPRLIEGAEATAVAQWLGEKK